MAGGLSGSRLGSRAAPVSCSFLRSSRSGATSPGRTPAFMLGAMRPAGSWPGSRVLPGGGAGAGWGYDDEGGYGYGEEDGVEELGARMAAMTADQRKAALEAAARSQSSKRYQEMERERKRRQLKTQGGQEKTTFFQSTKLALMNSGLIPLKKGELFPVIDSNSRHYLLVPVQ